MIIFVDASNSLETKNLSRYKNMNNEFSSTDIFKMVNHKKSSNHKILETTLIKQSLLNILWRSEKNYPIEKSRLTTIKAWVKWYISPRLHWGMHVSLDISVQHLVLDEKQILRQHVYNSFCQLLILLKDKMDCVKQWLIWHWLIIETMNKLKVIIE